MPPPAAARGAPVRRPGPAHRARGAGLRRPAAAGEPGGHALRRVLDARRPVPDRLGQRAPARALPAALQPPRPVRHGAARPRRALRAAPAVRVLGPRGLAAARRAAAAAALAHGARGGGGVGRHAADPAASGRSSSRRCSRRSARAGRCRERRARARAAEAHRAVVGLVRRRSARSSGCSGAGRSPPRAGAASSGSTTCPSACCRARSSPRPTPPDEDAQRELVRIAARSLGVAAERDLRDYYRLPTAEAKARVAELVGGRRAVARRGRGLARRRPTCTRRRALPRRVDAQALRRAVRLAGLGALAHRARCSASATGSRSTCRRPKRVHGYYVLPFLLGDRLVARVDLKADRQAGALRVQAAHAEPDAPARDRGGAGARSSRSMAGWLGLEHVVVVAARRPRAGARPAARHAPGGGERRGGGRVACAPCRTLPARPSSGSAPPAAPSRSPPRSAARGAARATAGGCGRPCSRVAVVQTAIVLGGVALILAAAGNEVDRRLDDVVRTVQRDVDATLGDLQQSVRSELDRRLPPAP